ncbi:NFIL3 like protein [Cricetulus griseus]|uniref:E4 promoter-binding protein 4 n=1 Tax=Cricetulus griseus TaxID=10029 RepID=G3I5Q0_CRIGR|nr:NFIL3 like protein [Cricetulus griseus]XP_027297979.1 NFIL3 like protein [Cricetulus griseus]EGW00131.1 Nuclear factor interleukin-3-regulated protein [Cricetulus griseus]ERE74100.1 nuclear factor interleukin-3-regulated protein [Cricetulus griseus]
MNVDTLGLLNISQGPNKALWGTRRGPTMRRQREFMPEEKKDTIYWEKRRKNNEAAKRSREKRRLNDMAIEGRLTMLLEENAILRAELQALKLRFGLLPSVCGARTLPLQALLWNSSWTGDSHSGADTFLSLPGAHGCLFKPYAVDSGIPGFSGCLVAQGWAGLAASPRFLQESEPLNPRIVDRTFHATFPAAIFGCHFLDGHVGSRTEFKSCCGLWSPVPTGSHAPGSSDISLTSYESSIGFLPSMTCSVPGDRSEGLAQTSLPHKLRIKSQALSSLC